MAFAAPAAGSATGAAAGGTSSWLVPLIASLASSGIAAYSSDKENSQRMAALRRAGETQQGLSKEAEALAVEGAKKYDPQARATAQDAAEQTAAQSLGTALTQAEAKLPNTDVQGNVSDEYLSEKGRASTERMARSMKLAQAMAKLRAPTDLRFNESIDNADVASRIGGFQSDAGNALRAGNLDASAVRPDSGLQLSSDVIGTGGAAYGGRADRMRRSGIYGSDTSAPTHH